MPTPGSTFGRPPGQGGAAGATTGTPVQAKAVSFIIIPLLRASPQLIGYAVQADDEIWDQGAGGGGGGGGGGSNYGSSGRGGSSSGYGGSSSNRGGSSSNRGGSSSNRGSSRGSSRGGSSYY
jgi:hypothetical protein